MPLQRGNLKVTLDQAVSVCSYDAPAVFLGFPFVSQESPSTKTKPIQSADWDEGHPYITFQLT